MRFNVRALALTAAVVWGAGILVTGLANMVSSAYGYEFLQLMASLYPGYQGTASIGQVIIGTLYGALDAAIAAAIFAWLYNLLGGRASAAA